MSTESTTNQAGQVQVEGTHNETKKLESKIDSSAGFCVFAAQMQCKQIYKQIPSMCQNNAPNACVCTEHTC